MATGSDDKTVVVAAAGDVQVSRTRTHGLIRASFYSIESLHAEGQYDYVRSVAGGCVGGATIDDRKQPFKPLPDAHDEDAASRRRRPPWTRMPPPPAILPLAAWRRPAALPGPPSPMAGSRRRLSSKAGAAAAARRCAPSAEPARRSGAARLISPRKELLAVPLSSCSYCFASL